MESWLNLELDDLTHSLALLVISSAKGKSLTYDSPTQAWDLVTVQ